jgi:hypothetical protein
MSSKAQRRRSLNIAEVELGPTRKNKRPYKRFSSSLPLSLSLSLLLLFLVYINFSLPSFNPSFLPSFLFPSHYKSTKDSITLTLCRSSLISATVTLVFRRYTVRILEELSGILTDVFCLNVVVVSLSFSIIITGYFLQIRHYRLLPVFMIIFPSH